LLVFVVQEESSTFPFAVRLALVQKGAAHIPNCRVLPGGSYMVSRQTFPAYFTGHEKHASAHAALDSEIFSRRIAPALNIEKRFVGTEPFCPVTAKYNAAMRERLPKAGIELVELKRCELNGMAVSASALRQALRDDDWQLVERLAPATTLEFLRSPKAEPIISALKAKTGRH
jgi:[citrate (pro-3S)-lyase] ligase